MTDRIAQARTTLLALARAENDLTPEERQVLGVAAETLHSLAYPDELIIACPDELIIDLTLNTETQVWEVSKA